MKRKPSHHLTQDKRSQIYALLKCGQSTREIGNFLGFHHGTIAREINRNKSSRGYNPTQAQKKSDDRRHNARSGSQKLVGRCLKRMLELLYETDASPQQISGRLALEGLFVSHESIYKYILCDKTNGGQLFSRLRHNCKKYNKRKGKTAGRGCIPNRVDITERPKEVELKQRFGDFELDTIVGKDHQGAIVSIVDRASKYTFLALLPRGTAAAVRTVLCDSLKNLSDLKCVHTLTSDNGKEFAEHVEVAQKLRANFYFATPYHSWERGLNEHTNGLVRQYFPKGTEFGTLTNEDVAMAQWKINNRPRAILNFMTPTEKALALVPGFTPVAFQP